jgi:hypothetical protein
MDELDRFRAFRSGVAAPSEDARRRASALLATAVDAGQPARAPAARLIATRRGYGALALAAIVGATATALFVTTPWSNSRGFLAKAEAALAPPAGTVLHMKLETTSTWTRRFCTVIHGQGKVWVDGASPHSYRLLLNDLPDPADPRALGCSSGTSEYGGTYRSKTLRFVPPNRLSIAQQRFRFSLDPAADLREAISTGRAHDEGKTQLDGRTVERIRIDPPSACPPLANCPREPLYVYVDPETFYPVEIVATLYQVEIVGGPGTSTYSRVGVRDVMRYLTFEYLPRTAANLALTDIRAQHPDATGP